MKLTVTVLMTVVLLSMACKTDYDIEEVASSEFLGTGHHDEHDECEIEDAEHPESEHEHETNAVEPDSLQEQTDEHDALGISGSDRHLHDPGARNHGTAWFFNQPWAATFIWGKMVRDTVILLLIAAAVLFVSGYRRKRR